MTLQIALHNSLQHQVAAESIPRGQEESEAQMDEQQEEIEELQHEVKAGPYLFGTPVASEGLGIQINQCRIAYIV